MQALPIQWIPLFTTPVLFTHNPARDVTSGGELFSPPERHLPGICTNEAGNLYAISEFTRLDPHSGSGTLNQGSKYMWLPPSHSLNKWCTYYGTKCIVLTNLCLRHGICIYTCLSRIMISVLDTINVLLTPSKSISTTVDAHFFYSDWILHYQHRFTKWLYVTMIKSHTLNQYWHMTSICPS